MKILTVLGARPQFIKASALSREIRKHKPLKEVILHTGQHFDNNMSEIFFREMDIPVPEYNLGIHGLSHGEMTGKMLQETEKVILLEKPDFVLVYGDTNSTLAGALSARKLKVKVIHVEAGLRSYNMNMPEEINRILTDRISNLLFCPTNQAIENLKSEGFEKFDCKFFLSGDVMFDNAIYFSEIAERNSSLPEKLGLEKNNFLLCTLHRAENTDDPARINSIFSALNNLSKTYQIVLPMHPRTASLAGKLRLDPSITVIDPVGYLDMIKLIRNSILVLTDSGGLQKEAYFFKKFCVTLRDETEWTELTDNGFNFLAGADPAKILSLVSGLTQTSFPLARNFYGNGNSSGEICRILLEYAT